MTFLHSRQDALTTELSSLGVDPFEWDPSDRKWIRVVTQLARRCGQEGQCSTCTRPHRPVTVVNRLIPTKWKEAADLEIQAHITNSTWEPCKLPAGRRAILLEVRD